MNEEGISTFDIIFIISIFLCGLFLIILTDINLLFSNNYNIIDESIIIPCYDNEGNYIINQTCYETKTIYCDGFLEFFNDKECDNLSKYYIIKE